MIVQEVLEVLMLLCFSVGWYWSIARMLMIRAAVGKSPAFVLCVCTGYACGVGAKIAIWQAGGALSPLVWLYAWNMMVTCVDLLLVLYFTRRSGAAFLRRGRLS